MTQWPAKGDPWYAEVEQRIQDCPATWRDLEPEEDIEERQPDPWRLVVVLGGLAAFCILVAAVIVRPQPLTYFALGVGVVLLACGTIHRTMNR